MTEGNSGMNGTVDVCVVLEDAMDGLEREVTVTFTTTGGTAGMHSDLHKFAQSIPSIHILEYYTFQVTIFHQSCIGLLRFDSGVCHYMCRCK